MTPCDSSSAPTPASSVACRLARSTVPVVVRGRGGTGSGVAVCWGAGVAAQLLLLDVTVVRSQFGDAVGGGYAYDATGAPHRVRAPSGNKQSAADHRGPRIAQRHEHRTGVGGKAAAGLVRFEHRQSPKLRGLPVSLVGNDVVGDVQDGLAGQVVIAGKQRQPAADPGQQLAIAIQRGRFLEADDVGQLGQPGECQVGLRNITQLERTRRFRGQAPLAVSSIATSVTWTASSWRTSSSRSPSTSAW